MPSKRVWQVLCLFTTLVCVFVCEIQMVPLAPGGPGTRPLLASASPAARTEKPMLFIATMLCWGFLKVAVGGFSTWTRGGLMGRQFLGKEGGPPWMLVGRDSNLSKVDVCVMLKQMSQRRTRTIRTRKWSGWGRADTARCRPCRWRPQSRHEMRHIHSLHVWPCVRRAMKSFMDILTL